jgi:asparagine synthase (glutamine-hydrolysing)
VCGIVGVFGYGASKVNLKKSIELLTSRGPDAQYSISPHSSLNLGAARLAMTDPHPRSNQPFEKHSDWIVFNGEIYNHAILRKLLEQEHKVIFKTFSDTEVLLEIIRTYGHTGVSFLNGMYSFAYYNSSEEKLILGRDKLGKKPLYFSFKESNFYWASTLPALKVAIGNPEINRESILTYLAFGYSIDPNTFYEGVQSVKPGFTCEVNYDLEIKHFKSPDYYENVFDLANPYNQENLQQLLSDSVSTRMNGHDRAAISLSGGLDSSIIASLAANINKEIVAYSLKWSDTDKARYNIDFEKAQTIARNLDIKFIGVNFEDDERNLDKLIAEFIRYMGEPNSNPTGVSLIPLYRRISQDGFRLLLTGDGSDEIFGGYPRYNSQILKNRFRFLNPRSGNTFLNSNSYLSKLALKYTKADNPGIWANFHWNFTPTQISLLQSNNWSQPYPKIVTQIYSSIETADVRYMGKKNFLPVEKVMNRDSDIWLTNESNRKLDRISMAFSMEARSPFQDEKVINAAKKEMSKQNFKFTDKSILRDKFPNLDSLGIRDDKAGFISPVGHWLRNNPNVVKKGLDTLKDSGYFRPDELTKRSRDQFTGDFDRIRQLWSLIILGYWFNEG